MDIRSVHATIPELDLIDKIEALSNDYEERHGRAPINVSHWDPSQEIVRKLRAALPISVEQNPIPYNFSYFLDSHPEVRFKLGIRADASSLFLENGSSAILAVANVLALSGVSEVVVVRPCYFTVPYALARVGLRTREVYAARRENGYALPVGLELDSASVLWITHPIYNTGDYGLSHQCRDLLAHLEAGVVVVADEALALCPSGLAAVLGGHPRFIGIYTPHKSICVNGLKFSTVVFHPDKEPPFDHWTDVLSGGLGLSAVTAINHFLSTDFDTYRDAFLAEVNGTREWHTDLLAREASDALRDHGVRGHFLTVYFPNLPAGLGDDLPFLAEVLEASGASLIPGSRIGFDPAWGFCFRVNLARGARGARGARVARPAKRAQLL
jgi:histidinol-phosphate/aromatic aminotransferase/cobyric acid decarboxylase-like protein